MALRKGNRDLRGTEGTPRSEPAAQENATDLTDAFHEADRGGPERLDAVGRAEQERLRTALYLYVDGLWDHVKARARTESGSPSASRSARHPADQAFAASQGA
jgi:hypothetical protein